MSFELQFAGIWILCSVASLAVQCWAIGPNKWTDEDHAAARMFTIAGPFGLFAMALALIDARRKR